jgi:DNA-binding GntR family transcriptional regulator
VSPGRREKLNGIEIKNVVAAVLEHVRHKIITGAFKPGQRVSESKIASILDVSRSPVREAFRVLEGQGLIETLPRRGSFVAQISVNDLCELFELRKLLEFHAIDCIQKRAKKSPDKFKALVNDLETKLYKKPNRLTVTPGFHERMVMISNNHRLGELYKVLEGSLLRYWLIYYYRKKEIDTSFQHHRKIVSALKRENCFEAKKLLKTHFRYVENVMKKKITDIFRNERVKS